MNTTVKKQNRILLAALVVILAAAAILIAVTGGANKKEKETVPTETEQTTEGKKNQTKTKDENTASAAKETTPESVKTPAKSDEIPFETEQTSPKTEDSAETIPSTEEVFADTTVSATVDADEPLPTFSLPVDDFILKGYSADIPVFSYTMNDYRTHEGVDIAASAGTPVLAAADGTVCEVVHDPMMGVTIGIQHTGGAVTRYKGLSEDSVNLVEMGANVKRGQVIGAAGDTALIESAEEGHVHFELTVDGESRDPAEYMKVTYLADVHEG